MSNVNQETQFRSLWQIAEEITRTWTNPYFGAVPYLNAMKQLRNITDQFYDDDAETVVMYFLANAETWRGETARRIKKELNMMLKSLK